MRFKSFVFYQTALSHAIENEEVEIVKYLLSNPKIDINMKSKSEIKEGGGCISYFEYAKTNEKSSLFYAIENGNINTIRALLEKQKIDINFGIKEYLSCYGKIDMIQDKSPLYLAVEKQNLEMVQLLLKQPNIEINYVFRSCRYQNNNKPIIQQKTIMELASEKPNTEIKNLLSKY